MSKQITDFDIEKLDQTLFIFNGKKLNVFGTTERPMFLAKEVGDFLGLVNIHKNLSTLDEDEKATITISESGQLRYKTIISESAVYKLVFKSRKDDALKFQNWVCKEVLPEIRKTGVYKLEKQLVEYKQRDDDLSKQLQEARELEIRLNLINKELLSYKKMQEKSESVYIVSNKSYAQMGIYKIGRTSKTMKTRLSCHNNTHVRGDKFKVLAEFKVSNSKIVEALVHKKLQGLLVEGEREFFLCPYNLIYDLVDLIVNQDGEQNKTVNKIIDVVFLLKQKNFNYVDWTIGLNMNIFDEEIKMITDGKEIASFNVSDATEEQKNLFIQECMQAYVKTITEPLQPQKVVWKKFQECIITSLSIPISKFKPMDWKPLVKNYATENQLTIQWKP
jgi:prophage antirepressor-like protein